MKSKPHIQSLTENDLETLLCTAHPPTINALFTILADTGLRVAELCGLLNTDLWLYGEPMHVLDVRAAIAKNHKPRMIPLSPRVGQAIENLHHHYWPPNSDAITHFAFHGASERVPMATRTVERYCETWGRDILHRRLTPHMFRHTFATRLMRKCDTPIVQALLGHSSLQSTQIYLHPNTQDLQSAIDALRQ